MAARASIIIWSAGSGMLLGVFIDAALIGLWAVASALVPSLSPRPFPRWASYVAVVVLTAIPLGGLILGYFEGRLKVE